MLTLNEIKNAIRSNIIYAHPEDIDDAANEILHIVEHVIKIMKPQEPKLVSNEDGQ